MIGAVAGLIEGVLALAGPGRQPLFFLLDEAGRVLYAAGGEEAGRVLRAGPPRRLQEIVPAGWETVLLRLDFYDRSTGHLGVAAPPGELGPWRAVAEALHGLERERRRQEFELDSLSEAMVKRLEEIDLLDQTARELSLALAPEEFWAKALKVAAEAVAARRAYFLLASQGRPGCRLVCAWEAGAARVEADREGAAPAPEAAAAFLGLESEGGIAGQALREGRPVAWDLLAQPRDDLAPFERGAATVLAMPLVPELGQGRAGRVLGALVLVDRIGEDPSRRIFRSDDVKIAELIGSHVAIQLGNRRLAEYRKEVQIAGNIQKSLLPPRPPRVPGFDLAGRCEPARYVGGDYFDFFPAGRGETGLVIADVSGHTMASALMMPLARAALHWAGGREASASGILEETARLLHRDLAAAELFLTLFLALIRPGEDEVEVANAGHNPPLLVRPGGRREWLQVEGPILGFLPAPTHPPRRIRLEPGDALVLYTDGLVEAADEQGELFGEERLMATVDRLRELPAAEMVQGLFRAVRSFGDPGQDDVTVVVLRRTE